MKAFLAACIVIVAVSLIAGFGLESVQSTSGQSTSSPNVRLD
jgi:hypothetical protein